MNLELTLPPKVTPRAFARLAEINADGPARPLNQVQSLVSGTLIPSARRP